MGYQSRAYDDEHGEPVLGWAPEHSGLPGDPDLELIADDERTGLVVVPVTVREPLPAPAGA